MSLYQKASLVQIPSGTKVNKLYSVVPNNGDGDFTGTIIDADATRINKDGLVEDVSTNVARLNYDPTNPQDPHLLIESARANSFLYSELFNNSYWTKENVSTATGVTSPMGDTDAQNLIENTSTSRHRISRSMSVSAFNWYSVSVWAKSSDRNLVINADFLFNARSGFNLSTGTTANTTSGTATITEYPNGWYKCTVTGQATTSHTQLMYIQMQTGTTDANYTGNGSSKVSLFGAQFEAGIYTTSYIPTSGTELTRTEDNIYAGGDANLFNDTEGTLFVDIEPFTYDGIARITLSDSSTSDRIVIGTANSTQFRLLVIQGGAAPFRMDTFRNITYNTRNKIAITYKQNEYKLAINGTVVLTTTNTGLTPQGLNQLRFSDGDSGLKWRGKVFQTMVFNEALSNTELQELTSL